VISWTDRFCFFLYIVSALIVAYLSFQVINVRSACTHERAKISKLVKDIKDLKEENVRLMAEYYSMVKPLNVDNRTQDLKLFHENEVEYLK